MSVPGVAVGVVSGGPVVVGAGVVEVTDVVS